MRRMKGDEKRVIRRLSNRDVRLLTECGLRNVRSLSLKHQTLLLDASLGPFLSSLPRDMERVHLMCREIGPSSAAALCAKTKIQTLLLHKVRRVDAALASRFPLTDTLGLDCCGFVSSAWLQEVAVAGRLSGTSELSLAGIRLSPDDGFLSALKRMPLLQRLDISHSSTPAGRGFDAAVVKIVPFLPKRCTVRMSSKELSEFLSPSTKTLCQDLGVVLTSL